MKPDNNLFIETLDRLFPMQISHYLKNLYKNIQELENLGILDLEGKEEFEDTLNDLCISDDYRDSELQYIIRDMLLKQTIGRLHENGLSIIVDEEYIDLKSLDMIVNAIVLYLNDESPAPLPIEEDGDNLYEAIAGLVAMYSELNIVQARDLINDVSLTFCNKLTLCLKLANMVEDDEDYRIGLVTLAVNKDPLVAGTRIVNDLVLGNLQEINRNFKDDQKTLIKYMNKCDSLESAVRELLAYLYMLESTNVNLYQLVENNLSFESLKLINNSNDNKFKFLKLLESGIK